MSRILVIDDNANIVALLRRVLERAGHDVRTTSDGPAGVRAFREHGADLIITDIYMPEQDGIETILQLRALDVGVKIIAISGGDQTETHDSLQVAALLGAVRTMPKPLDTAELLGAVAKTLAEPPA